MTRMELMPIHGEKSFYGKAFVRNYDNGDKVLESYGTDIIRVRGGMMIRLWDDWSATTGRHIKAFCGLNKKGYMALCTPETMYKTQDDI